MPSFDDGMVNMAEPIRVMAGRSSKRLWTPRPTRHARPVTGSPTSGSTPLTSRAETRAGRRRPRSSRSHSRYKEASASPLRPPSISPPTRKATTSFFSRDLVPIIIFIRNAESCRNQLAVFRQVEKAAVCARLSKKTVDLCELDHLFDASLIE